MICYLLFSGSLGSGPLIRLPETVTLSGAARFSPRDGTIEPGSVEITLRVPHVHVSIDRWQYILAIIDNQRTKNGRAPLSPLTSPLSSRTPMLMSASSSSVRDFGRIIIHILMLQLSPIIVHSFHYPLLVLARKRLSR